MSPGFGSFRQDPTRSDSILTEEEKQDVFNMFSQITSTDLVGVDAPANVKCTLYPHQKLALEFMLKCEKNRAFKGGIIADVMGLGKVSILMLQFIIL
jgi:SNF2 family DNA or RNA helicase